MSTKEKVLTALVGYDLVEEKIDQYRCNSPLRAGANSHSFTLTIEDDEHGAFFDHVSEEKGSLYDLAKALGIETPLHQVTDTKRGYRDLADYARAHGLPPETLINWRWYETQCHNRRALAFPTHTGLRFRFLDGQSPYYMSEKGYKRSWYGLSAWAMKQIVGGAPLVIANGEISTIAGQYWGIAATCITAGETAIPLELLTELKTFLGDLSPRIIVALDCDSKGRKASSQMVSQLTSAGYEAYAVDLGLDNKGDLADFCMLNEKNVLGALMSLPAMGTNDTTRQTRFKFLHVDELANLPPIRWIIQGEIPESGLVLIYGASGVGKSFLGIDYALRIGQERTVVYVSAEGEHGLGGRTEAWKKHHQKPGGKVYFLPEAVKMMDSEILGEFIEDLKLFSPQIVFVDTVARAMVGSDENSTRDMGVFVDACDQVRKALNCVVVLVHHSGKQGSLERGNSSLRAAVDTVIRVTGDDDVVSIESSKSKDSQPFETRYMRRLSVDVVLGGEPANSAVLVPSDKVVVSATDSLTPNQTRILQTLALEIHKAGISYKNLLEETDVPRGSLSRILNRLKQMGFISQPSFDSYAITEAGLNRVSASPASVASPILTENIQHRSENVASITDSTDATDARQQNRLFGTDPNTYYERGL